MMEIRYVNHGIGNNFGDFIELNEHLKDYPELHKAVLEHELGHTNKVFTKQDFIADIRRNKARNIDLIKFILRHPKALSQFLPFYYSREHGFVYDINCAIIEFSALAIIGISVFLSFKLI